MKMNINEFCERVKTLANVKTHETLNKISPSWLLSAYYEDFEKFIFKDGTSGKITGVYYCKPDIEIEYVC